VPCITKIIRLNAKIAVNMADKDDAQGNIYNLLRDYDKAISDYTEAIRLNPNYAAAYHDRGLAYKQLGKNAQSQADFDKAKQLSYTGPQ
jgi:tetratricopeptide (TPR) repeat protein